MMRLARKQLAPAASPVETGDWLVNRFGLTTKVVVHAGQRDALVDLLLVAAERVADAPGCYLYVVSTSLEEPDGVWVSEAWRSKAHYEAWMSRPDALQLLGGPAPRCTVPWPRLPQPETPRCWSRGGEARASGSGGGPDLRSGTLPLDDPMS